jgi:hypothetical protein
MGIERKRQDARPPVKARQSRPRRKAKKHQADWRRLREERDAGRLSD